MKISVFDKKEVIEYIPSGLSALIRVSDSFHMPKVKGSYSSIIKFYFSDVEDELSDYAISEKEALELASFIKSLKDYNEVVVHCDYGQGRSPAIAYVISKYFGIPFDKKSFPNINNLVISKLEEVLNLS